MNSEDNDFGGQTDFDLFTQGSGDAISNEMASGLNHDNFTDIPVFDPLGDEMELSGPNISFGATPSELQVAANIAQMAEWAGDSLFGKICGNVVDSIRGADVPGMEVLEQKVHEISDFYNIDPVKVFYEEGEPGVQFSGMTTLNYDNWIGGDPQVLSQFSEIYGDDFVTNVIAHETGHQIFDRLGLEKDYPRIANEACADYIAGLYAGSRGLDPEGFAEFLKQHPGDGELYPENRYELYMEAYNKAKNYEWNMFQDIVDDSQFDLKATLEEIANRY